MVQPEDFIRLLLFFARVQAGALRCEACATESGQLLCKRRPEGLAAVGKNPGLHDFVHFLDGGLVAGVICARQALCGAHMPW